MASKARLLLVKDISLDNEFANTRIIQDPLYPSRPTTSVQSLEALEQSMKTEGLKIPIIVVERWEKRGYYVRAGFRRFGIAQKLRWEKIPAIVLPCETSAKDQYWCNVIENSTRKTLTTYETAWAAKLMREKFKVTASEFAERTGFTAGYVSHLLTCMDRLPVLLLDQWKAGANLTFEEWYKLSQLDHFQALQSFRRWTGTSVSQRMKEISDRRSHSRKLAPAKWLERLQKIYIGLEGSELEPRMRDLCLKVVECCMGQRDNIPGAYDPRKEAGYKKKAEMRRTLKLYDQPGPDDPPPKNDEVPKPVDEENEDDVYD